jgi:hypothetical protein
VQGLGGQRDADGPGPGVRRPNRGTRLEIDDPGAGMREAPRREPVDSATDFAWLVTKLRSDSDIRVRRAGHLTVLRLLDIIAWTPGVSRLGSKSTRL